VAGRTGRHQEFKIRAVPVHYAVRHPGRNFYPCTGSESGYDAAMFRHRGPGQARKRTDATLTCG
jgi:hypothetical protein